MCIRDRVGSGEEYGHVLPQDVPLREETVLRPGNLYAATKAAQNMIGAIYALSLIHI